MTPESFALTLSRYAAAYDAHSWRVARLAHDVRESGVKRDWAEAMALEFGHVKRWAQNMAQVYAMTVEFPFLRRFHYSHAKALYPYLAKEMTLEESARLWEMMKTFSRERTSLERMRAELSDAFGAPELTPVTRWHKYADRLLSDAERIGANDPRAPKLEQAARLLRECE